MALPISTFIDVRTVIQTGGVARLPFGRGLLLTADANISAGGSTKALLFNSLAEAGDVLDSGDAMDAATVWFSADPAPQGLWVGRWATTDVATTLTGGTPADATAFTAANYSFAINGTDVVTIDLGTATTYATIATAIAARLVTVITGATVAFTNGAFVFTMPDSRAIDPAYLTVATTGTALAALLGMDQASAPTYIQGHDTETAVEALGDILALTTAGAPVGAMLAGDAPLTSGTVDTREAVAAYAQGNNMVFGLLDTSAQALVANDTTSHSALAFSRNQGNVASVFDNAGQLPDLGLLAFMSAQNLDNPASLATPHAKPIPGVAASNVTPTQYVELKRKRVNIVTQVGNSTRLVGGYTSRAGYWLDSVWWLMWLRNKVIAAQWEAMGSARRLTSVILTDALTEVFSLGIDNGGIEPGGKVNAATKADIIATTGNTSFDGTLVAGYLLYVTPPSRRTLVDRASRVASWKSWLAPTEAIHELSGDIILSG